jgi:beta-lactamase class D
VVRADLEAVFEAAGITGTFALLDTGSGELTVVEPEMAAERAAPASTFKIANSLIALDAGAVADVDEVVPFTGGPQPNPEWEHDMSMREALPISAYPIFQELARRVGPEEMAARVEEFGYGNADIGGPDDIDSFWLEGPLAISAVEQVRFVSDVVTGGLPVDPAHVDAVRPLLRDDGLSAEGGPTVYGKTGWSDKVDPDVGWFVGWVDDGSAAPQAFALRIDMDDDGDVEQRRPLTEELLTRLGVLPPSGS